MLELIKESYGFTDYQIAQLKYLFLTIFSEISKFLIIGLFFLDNIKLYICTILLFLILRSNNGGLHCKTYLSCFVVSLSYIFLSIRVLPLIPTFKVLQMLTLLLCIIITYHIGPIVSSYRPIPTESVCRRQKNKLFMIIFIFLITLYILPENPYTTTGYWVIILNTCQLILAKLLKKEGH